jgi:hypothetical protein
VAIAAPKASKDRTMTIVPVHQLDIGDLQLLGNNTAEAIRLDHDELQAGNQELDLWDFQEPATTSEQL